MPELDPTQAASLADALTPDGDGLVPAVVQDHASGAVLMLAWMSREALVATLTSGRATYHSRSRGRLWRKGETSGNIQEVREVRLDCDGDTLLLTVRQTGPACHTGAATCFYRLATEAGWAVAGGAENDTK